MIKSADDKPLERFIFAIKSTVLDVESFNKDTCVEGAITVGSLGQYFRSFLVKLNMIEAQLGQIEAQGGEAVIERSLSISETGAILRPIVHYSHRTTR